MNGLRLRTWILTGSSLGILLCARPIAAQVIPDATLPAGERSQVTGNPNVQIDGGAVRGSNLFHSFSQFSIPTGGSAFFNNAPSITTIFTRITGSSSSNIDGLIRANGTANLFVLNPNGILFGPNALLNIGGSFVATTANAIGFSNGEVFSSDATQPLPSQLLSVNPNALLFNQLAAQAIVNQSTANSGIGLQVPAGQSLLLVGGDVRLEGGQIVSPGSRVELAAVAGQGSVGLSEAAGEWRLNVPDSVTRSDVSLSSAFVDVRGNNGGSITITARNLTLDPESRLSVGIKRGLGFPGAQAGDMQLDVTQAINADGGFIGSQVLSGSTGNGGDINITTESLSLTNGALLSSYTSGRGDAGSVIINARDYVFLDGTDIYNCDCGSAIFSAVSLGGVGNSGGINITTESLSLTNGALLSSGNALEVGQAGDINITVGSLSLTGGSRLSSSTFGRGDAGSVIINARDLVSIDGAAYGGVRSGIYTQVASGAVGQGGSVAITTGSLFLTNGGAVNTTTAGQGNAGRVTIRARGSVQIRGRAPTNTDLQSGVFTTATAGSVGDGGAVTITTGSLSVSNQGRIITDVRSQGNAGNIQIQASDTVLFDGGDAISTLSTGGVGRGGDIEIAARSLSLLNGAQLSTSTAGEGNAGNITVETPDLQLSGATSGLFAQTTSSGNAGNLTIQPRDNGQSVRVNLQGGAQISASTSSSGRGGDLTIAAPESITLTGNGSVIAAGTGGSGNGGNVNLRTRNLNIQNQAEVTVSSSGSGSAGNLFVDANRIFLNNQGSIRADTSGGGGNISLRSPLIVLRNGSNISTNATGENIPGGNIAIDTRFLIAVLSEDSNISANSTDFRGGNVSITAFSIFGIQPSLVSTPLSDITATGATSALGGTIDITTAGFDPTAGLVVLPTNLADPGLIAQGCPANEGNSFVITGRGGLPPTPEQQLDDDAEWSDRRRLVVAGSGEHGESDANLSASSPHTPIIEATRIQVTPTGEAFLVANSSSPVMQNWLNRSVVCSGGKSRQ